MRFGVVTQQIDGLELVILKDHDAGTELAIVPAYGALLHALIVQTHEGPFNLIDHYDNLETLQSELSQSYKGSKLSPFACRIPFGRYEHDGQLLQLENIHSNGSSIHGLLFNKPFKIVDTFYDDSHSSVLLKYNYKKEDNGYPFEYRCEVQYSLLGNNIVQVVTTLFNLDAKTIPVADGWHPYFKLGGKADNWLLRFNADCIVPLDEYLVPDGRLLPYHQFQEEELIKDAMLDNCFLLKKEEAYAACTLFNPGNGLALSFFPDQSYPYLLLYIPPERMSIAIENLSGAPNCFNNKMGLIMLGPRQSKTFTTMYQISME